MTSIRTRLLVTLIGAVLLTGAVAGWFTYRNARSAADAFFDEHLRQTALSLRDQAFEYAAAPDLSEEADFDFVIQVWSLNGVRIYLSRPHTKVPGVVTLGYGSADVAGDPWRSFGVEAHGHVIQVAQPERVREQRAIGLALRTLLPFALAVPFLALFVGIAVGRGLRPLDALASQVRDQDPELLGPLPLQKLPKELQPLAGSLNDLLGRLSESRSRERRFLDDAAHELRSPLTALHLQLQTLESSTETERAAALRQVGSGVTRATRLVEQLLALARQQPQAERSHRSVNLAAIAREVVGGLAPVGDAAGVDLGVLESPDTKVLGDADALATLLRNLVDNALRYTPRGGRVDVAVVDDGTSGPAWIVSDTGPGIPAAERARVFDRFHRLPGAPATGSGLGLSIVRAVAESHGATIELGDTPEGGLTVTVRFAQVRGAAA